MSLSPAGELHVSSWNNKRVCVFDLTGAFQRFYTAPGFQFPNCVTFDSGGSIYAASASTGLIFKWDPAEQFVTSFGPPAPFSLVSPMGIARDENDVLHVAGGSSNNIVRFATDGTFLGQITHPDLTTPQGVCLRRARALVLALLQPGPRGRVPARRHARAGPSPAATSTSPAASPSSATRPSVTPYCTAKPGLVCGLPVISARGIASATSNGGPGADFTISAGPARSHKSGLLIYTDSGRSAVPFQGGTLCIRTPLRRSPAADSGGAPGPGCSGTFSLDLNAFNAGLAGGNPAPFLATAGVVVDCQWWGRDSVSTGSFLSAALEFTVGP